MSLESKPERPDIDSPRQYTGGDLEEVMPFDQQRILFQGSGLLAIDKPAGVPVHATAEWPIALPEVLAEWARLHPGSLGIRPDKKIHPLHLLDREASGVVLFGVTGSMRRRVQAALAEHRVRRRYVAVIAGPIDESGELRGRVRSRLRGKVRMLKSSTVFRRLCGDERLSLIEVEPVEGRTHQIRVLFADAGRPLAGDLRYGKPKPARQFLEKFGVEHLLLHVMELALPANILGGKRTIRAPLPESFLSVMRQKEWDPGVFEGA